MISCNPNQKPIVRFSLRLCTFALRKKISLLHSGTQLMGNGQFIKGGAAFLILLCHIVGWGVVIMLQSRIKMEKH